MSVVRKRYSADFKLEICKKIEVGQEGKLKTCREHGLSPSLVDYWLSKYRQSGSEAFDDATLVPASLEARVKELEASLGRAHLENEFLREALGKLGIPAKRLP